MLFFSFDAWKSIHQNINKIRVVLNLAEVDCLRQASIMVLIIQQIPKLSKEQSMQ